MTASGRGVIARTSNTTRQAEARVRLPSGGLARPQLLSHDLEANSYLTALPAGRGVIG
jgi:hypothetical protein